MKTISEVFDRLEVGDSIVVIVNPLRESEDTRLPYRWQIGSTGSPTFFEATLLKKLTNDEFDTQSIDANGNEGFIVESGEWLPKNYSITGTRPKSGHRLSAIFANQVDFIVVVNRDIEHNPIRSEDAKKSEDLDMWIERLPGGRTSFNFSVAKPIQEMYRTMASGEKASEKWKGLKFYEIPSLVKDENYKEKLREYGLFDNFGDGFYKDRRANIAWLRTVGGKGAIELDQIVAWSELGVLQRNILSFLKEYFGDFISAGKIHARIAIYL